MAIILECKYNTRKSTLNMVKDLVGERNAEARLVLLDPTKDYGIVAIQATSKEVTIELVDKYEFPSNVNIFTLKGDYNLIMGKVTKLLNLPLKYSLECELEVLLKGSSNKINYESNDKIINYTPATLLAWLLDATDYNTYTLDKLVMNFIAPPNELEVGARSNRK